MQSLLFTGAGSTKNNDINALKTALSVDKNSDTSSTANTNKSSQNFTKIMQDAVHKEQQQLADKSAEKSAEKLADKAVDDAKSSAETETETLPESDSVTDHEQDDSSELVDDQSLPVISDPIEETELIDIALSQETDTPSATLAAELKKLTALWADNTQNSATTDAKEGDVSVTDTKAASGDNISQQKALLSQIEAAQQVNTSIKSGDVDTENGEEGLDLLTAEQENDALLESSVIDKSKLTLAAKVDTMINAEAGVLEVSHGVTGTLKHESLTVQDVNSLKVGSTGGAALDKLVSFNQQSQASNNLLQQPLDLHSKQAAAMMGDRVMMMISQGKQEVQIRLDPAELGTMFIKVQIQQEQVQLSIQTQMGSSKDLVEQHMPRLREQLAQQGIQLGEANVQQQSQQQGQQQHDAMQNAEQKGFSGLNNMSDEVTAEWVSAKIPHVDQGIDYYA